MTPIQPSDEAIGTLLNVALQEFRVRGGRCGVEARSAAHLSACDESVTLYLVTQLGIPELRNANRLIKQLPAEGGPTLEVVVNRFDSGSQGIDEEHVAKALTRPVRWKIPNDYAAVRQMQNSATPITQEDSPIARAIRQMTADQSAACPPIPEKKKRFSFFSF